MWGIQVGSSCPQMPARKLSICIITRFRQKDNRKVVLFLRPENVGRQEKIFGKGKKGPNCC